MARPKIYLIVGVPGSGKTWVCKQLSDVFDYIPQDKYIGKKLAYHLAIKSAKRTVVTDVPFGEAARKLELEKLGFEVIPIFIIEQRSVVASRYRARERKALDPSSLARASTLVNRARQWRAFHGTSKQVLDHLLSKV